MTMLPRARLRALAAGSVFALAAGTASVLGTAQPASAAGTTMDFDCAVPVVGTQTFPVTIESTPAEALPGSSTAPHVTVEVRIFQTLADMLRSVFQATSIEGVIDSTMLVDTVPQQAELTIPPTGPGDPGTEMAIAAAGDLAPVDVGSAGTVTDLAAGVQDVVLMLTTPQGTSPLPITCTPADGVDTTYGHITSTKASSTTDAAVTYSASKDKAKASATVTGSQGVAPTGKVKFVLKRGTQKVDSVTKALTDGKASATFTGVRKTGKYSVVATYQGSGQLGGSSDTAKFRVS